METISLELMEKYQALQERLLAMQRVVVAYSGGVDSTLLLKVAYDCLDGDVLAVLAVSASLPHYERVAAEELAHQIGAPLRVVEKREMDDPRFVKNTPQRCYFCKAGICEQLLDVAGREGYAFVVDGSNADDRGDYRPGARAAHEWGMLSPLQDVGLTKLDIRELARALGLSNWDKPASACLVSRLPYGTPVSEALLLRIAEAEKFLRGLGLRQLRVRHHGDVARIEVPVEDFGVLLENREAVVAAFHALGYAYTTLDLAAFRSGSMNEVIDSDGR